MRYVDSLPLFDEILKKERPTGLVRLVADEPSLAVQPVAEVRKILAVYPALPVFLVRGTINDGESEERVAKFLQQHGIKERMLMLPVWWALWQGRIAVYSQGKAFMRDLIGVFKGKAGVESVIDWVETTLKAERGTGRIPQSGSKREKPAPPRGGVNREDDRPTRTDEGKDPRDPHSVLGIRPGASTEDVRKAYRALCAKYHPDKVAHLGDKHQEAAHVRIVEINAAYEALRNRGR